MMNNPARQRFLEALALVFILALAAHLRLTNHSNTPGWYTDEGTHINIAHNLLRGRVQYLAINQSTLLFGRLPLFELGLAALSSVFGVGMGTLRAFSGVLGVISVGLLYGVVRRAQGGCAALALLSALMHAIYPQAVLYSRFGFSYNLLAPLLLLTWLGLSEYLCSKRRAPMALAALAIGLGGASDLWMFVLLVPASLVVLLRDWRDLAWSLPLAALPFGVYAAVMLVSAPQAFVFDLRFTLLRLNTLSPGEQVKTLALNYTILTSQNHWMALGIVGLFLLRPARLGRLSLLLLLLPILILGRSVALHGLSFYYMIPLLPLVSLGMAALLYAGLPFAWQFIHTALRQSWRWPLKEQAQAKYLLGGTGLILFAVVATPFMTSVWWMNEQIDAIFHTDIDPFLLNSADARQVAAWINAQARPDDLVVASPGLAWLIEVNAADFQMSVAANGQATPHLPADIPPERFAFDPGYTGARFVVIDNLWRNWAMWDVPRVADMVRQVQDWPLVFSAGEIQIYRNPHFP